MNKFLSLAFSAYTAVWPALLLAPPHATERPTIPWLIAYSASRHGVPIDAALRRGWGESGWTNVVHANREGAWDAGPLQINSRYWPEVLAMTVAERVDLGVSIYAQWWRECGGNESCAARAYVIGHR